MSTQESTPPLNFSLSGISPAEGGAAQHDTFWRRVGAMLERAGEYLNPLLVKEVRQALKSRQFSLTFTLVLALGWVWSIIGITRLGPDVQYRPDGAEMFYGYYMILAFPLLLIVPYSAFRSLIAEREDNTYELVAITTLRPRQIVGGKLGSAFAQMLVYLSAAAPCLAFTYLLHGIDVLTICWIVFYTLLASIGFSLCALLLATVAKEKHWQVVFSVAIIGGLFWAFSGACGLVHMVLSYERLQFQSTDFWIANLMFLTFYAGTIAMLYLASAAQLTFTAENRSTPLRITMLVHQALYAGWIAFGYVHWSQPNRSLDPLIGVAMFYVSVTAVYWYFMGAFMCGESPDLSPRVKRNLPQTLLGRALFTWLNPGPGTGYLFALCNVLAAAVLGTCCAYYGDLQIQTLSTGIPRFGEVFGAFVLEFCYLTIYLGLGSLLLRACRKVTQVTLATSFLLNVLLLLGGWGIPWVVRMASNYRGTSGYNLMHITDPFWSSISTLNIVGPTTYVGTLFTVIPLTALVVLILNLKFIVPEIRHIKIATPARVEEEEKSLAPLLLEIEPNPASPWD